MNLNMIIFVQIVELKWSGMSDFINRKKVVQKLREHRRIFCPDGYHIYGFSILSKDEKARVDEIDNCIATIINLPSTEPKKRIAKVKNVDEINVYCGNCDTPLSDWWTYCPSCGARLEWE